MKSERKSSGIDRRQFLAASGGGLLAAAVPAAAKAVAAGGSGSAASRPEAIGGDQAASGSLRKIPIGVFDPVYDKLSLDEMLDRVSALGLEAMEIGTGGYPGTGHCPVDELLADAGKAKAWKKRFEDRGIHVATLSCHGNPVHPDAKHAARDIESFRNTVLLAERLDEKVIPYWKEAARFAREHGIKRLAFEMHPNFVVYNPRTLLKLREAVGEEIGANCDLSHLFWQGCDPVEVIHFLGKQGALFHAHMKDTTFYPENVNKYGVLNFAFEKNDLDSASETFRAVGYGHSASLWKSVVKAYMDVGFEGILSIENEDPILPGEVGVERAAYVLKNVRRELLGE